MTEKALEAASKALVKKYREYWPGSWPAKPEADGLSKAAIDTYLSTLTADHGELVKRRSPHIGIGGCPAMTNDADGEYVHFEALTAQAAINATLTEQVEWLTKERDAAQRAMQTVQNAAKTLASAQGTELEHLRQNATFDHRLRAEHESLLARDAQMTDALLAAEARAEAAEAELAKRAEPVAKYCTCANSITNPCIICGKPKFIDPVWLKRKLETDPDEGEVGAGFELFASPPASTPGAVKAVMAAIEEWYGGAPALLTHIPVEKIEAALSALDTVQKPGWRPIETLPSDDTLVLAGCAPDTEFPQGRVMVWTASFLLDNIRRGNLTPEHLRYPAIGWLPIPAAPTSQRGA